MRKKSFKKIALLFLFLFWGEGSFSPVFSFPEPSKESVILDDEVQITFTKWFEEIFNASSSRQLGITPRIYLVTNSAVNAGAAPGGRFIIFTGLFKLCETAEEFLGILAHEVAHVRGHHNVHMHVTEEKSMLTAAIAFALGGVAAIAAGDMAPLIAGMSGGANVYLRSGMKHSQDLEIAADAEAIKILTKLGIPLTGLQDFLKRMKKIYGAPDVDRYFVDHPPTEERISAIENAIQNQKGTTPWAKSHEYNTVFKRLRAKILGFTLSPKEVFRMYKGSELSDAYARSIAYARTNKMAEALKEIDIVLATHPNDPYALEIKSQIYLDQRKVQEAIQTLEKASNAKPQAMYLKFSLAHLLIETQQHLQKAEAILKEVTHKGEAGDFAWLLLGKVYDLQGKKDLSLLANAEHDARVGDKKAAEVKLKGAEKLSKDPKTSLRIADLKKSLDAEK